MTLDNLGIPSIQREWITEKELSDLTGFTRAWFQQRRFAGEGIPYTKFGDTKFAPIRYRVSDVEEWIKKHSVNPGEDNVCD